MRSVGLGKVNQARGPSAAARQAKGPSAAVRQTKGPRAADRQAENVRFSFSCKALYFDLLGVLYNPF